MKPLELVSFQLSSSTAEDAGSYFTYAPGLPLYGTVIIHDNKGRDDATPAGTYRIIEGEVFRILPGWVDFRPLSARKQNK